MNSVLSIALWPARGRILFTGVLGCAVVAAAATFLSHAGLSKVRAYVCGQCGQRRKSAIVL